MNIPKEKGEQVGMFLEKLADKRNLPGWLYDAIAGWLVSDDSKEEKEKQLAEKFDREFSCTANPGSEARRSYNIFARRHGLKYAVPAKIPLRRRMAFKVAAVLIPALVLTGSVFLLIERAKDMAEHKPVAMVSVSAPAGDEMTLLLPDSTKVMLSQGSEIRHAEGFDGSRSVELRGEACFNVTKAKGGDDRFSVHTDHLKVTVLGTEFKVHSFADEDYSTIDLYHGSVSVEAGARSAVLTPGQHLRLDHRTGEMAVGRIPVNELAYDGMPGLVFGGASLAEVFATIEKDYGVNIVISGPVDTQAADVRVRADFSKARSVEALMKSLALAAGNFTYEITPDSVIIKPIY